MGSHSYGCAVRENAAGMESQQADDSDSHGSRAPSIHTLVSTRNIIRGKNTNHIRSSDRRVTNYGGKGKHRHMEGWEYNSPRHASAAKLALAESRIATAGPQSAE